MARAVAEKELKAAILQARSQFVPAPTGSYFYDEWKSLRQGRNVSLLVFGAEWLRALQRVFDAKFRLGNDEIGTVLYVALQQESANACGKPVQFSSARTFDDAKALIEAGVESEGALYRLQSIRLGAAGSDSRAPAGNKGGKSKPVQPGAVFNFGDSDHSEDEKAPTGQGRDGFRRTRDRSSERPRKYKPGPCWCCGLAGDAKSAHRWSDCPDLEKLKGEANAKGITDVMAVLPHRPPPRRFGSGDGSSQPQRGYSERSRSERDSKAAGEDDDERSSTDGGSRGGGSNRRVRFAGRGRSEH